MSGSVSCGVIFPFSWVLGCTNFCCALQESVYLGVLSPFPDSQAEKPVVGPRTFAPVQELRWCNGSPVCGLSAQRLCNGANDDLLQEDLCHTLCLPGLLQPETLSPGPVCRSLLPHTSAGDTQTLKCRFSSVSCGGHWSFLSVLVHEFGMQIVLLMTNWS